MTSCWVQPEFSTTADMLDVPLARIKCFLGCDSFLFCCETRWEYYILRVWMLLFTKWILFHETRGEARRDIRIDLFFF